MRGQICIITAGGTQYCKASPIKNCGCTGNKPFNDPFPELPKLIDSDSAAQDLTSIATIAARQGGSGLADRLEVILTIARLVMIPEVNVSEAFIISALDLKLPSPVPPTPPTEQAN